MKKLFTLFAAAMAMLSAQATDYTGTLNVNVSGSDATPSKTTVTVNKADDGTYNLLLKNFILQAGEESMPVGTINITGVEAREMGGSTILAAAQDITIEPGDDASVSYWMGTMLGPVPVEMVGELKNDKFHTVINIEFSGMEIAVEFTTDGTAYQLPNSGFENYHNQSFTYGNQDPLTSDEANGWHMFLSGTTQNSDDPKDALLYLSGSMLNGTTHAANVTRPGSMGEKSLMLCSYDMWFTVANGTATTGRLNVGSSTAADPSNHSFNDLSMTDTDGNGDPFYALLSGEPDSLTVWVKFKQSKPQADYPYATINAVINDGTMYRDPENDNYKSGVVAKATNATIESKDFAWQRLTIPFDYDSYAANNAETKAILVTISTNATPGKGSTDTLYVDDIALVYNAKLASLKYNGSEVTGFDPDTEDYTITGQTTVSASQIEAIADGRGARIFVDMEETEDGVEADVAVLSADLKTLNNYSITFPGAKLATDGINATNATVKSGKTQYFNAAGQRVNANAKGLTIVRKADGTAVKVMK